MARQSRHDDLPLLLLRLRAARGFSLRRVARETKLDPTGLSRIERGITSPRRTTRIRLEQFLRKYGAFRRAA